MTDPTMPPYPGPPPGPPRTAPKKPSSRTAWIIGGAVVALFVMFWVIGTVSKSDDESDAAPAPIASSSSSSSAAPAPSTTVAAAPPPTTAAPACYPVREIPDAELSAFAAGLSLPPGVQVITGRVSTDSKHPGKVGVALDLCVPGSTSADALRPIATSIATALKSTDLGARTFALYVADMSPSYADEAKLKDPDYAVHLWNGKPSPSAENARWEVVGG